MRINRINALNNSIQHKIPRQINFSGQDVFIKNIKEVKAMPNEQILNEIIDKFSQFKEVEAIGIGGSSSAKTADSASDIDVYVFVTKDIPIEKRAEIVQKYSSNYEVGCEYFGSGDEFLVDKMNRQLDVMYFNKGWFEDNFNNVWVKHYPSNGYTTCFLHTLNVIDIKKDKTGWLQGLKNRLKTPYPTELKDNIN